MLMIITVHFQSGVIRQILTVVMCTSCVVLYWCHHPRCHDAWWHNKAMQIEIQVDGFSKETVGAHLGAIIIRSLYYSGAWLCTRLSRHGATRQMRLSTIQYNTNNSVGLSCLRLWQSLFHQRMYLCICLIHNNNFHYIEWIRFSTTGDPTFDFVRVVN